MTKEYTQWDVDVMYVKLLTGMTLTKQMHDDCERIRTLIKAKRNIFTSVPGSSKFWTIASSWMKVEWLDPIPGEEGDAEILKCWDKFVRDWYEAKNEIS